AVSDRSGRPRHFRTLADGWRAHRAECLLVIPHGGDLALAGGISCWSAVVGHGPGCDGVAGALVDEAAAQHLAAARLPRRRGRPSRLSGAGRALRTPGCGTQPGRPDRPCGALPGNLATYGTRAEVDGTHPHQRRHAAELDALH